MLYCYLVINNAINYQVQQIEKNWIKISINIKILNNI